MNSNYFFEKNIIRIVLLAGAILALVQYFWNRSLWIDEAFLALNVIEKNHSELLKPLDYVQVAPILFLQIEKIFSELIPNSEFGLRLFPLICYLFSLVLFYKIIKSIHQNPYTIIFSLSLFVFNATLIYYSSEVKQYMTDVFVLTSIYYLILKEYKKERYKYICLGIVGTISIFLSNVACIILFSAGLYLLFDIYLNKKKDLHYLIIISFIWITSFLLYYLLFILDHPSMSQQIAAFSSYPYAFMPLKPLSIQFYKFFWLIGKTITCGLFRFTIVGGIIISILTVIGLFGLIRKRNIGIIILAITPFFIHLLLSSFYFYPVQKRTLLYISVCICIVCSFGFNQLINILLSYWKVETSKLLAICIPLFVIFLMCFYIIKVGFPFVVHSETKGGINFIKQNIQNNDKIYVINCDATVPFQYYKKISYLKIEANNVIIENDLYLDSIKYADKLCQLSGRIWFLLGTDIEGDKKIKFLKNYFKSKDKNVIQEFHTVNTDVYLYDKGNTK